MDDDDFTTHFVVGNFDPPAKQPKGCWGWIVAIATLLAMTLAYCLM